MAQGGATTKESGMNCEDELQLCVRQQLDQLADETGDARLRRFHHSPNGGRRSKREGAVFRGMGVRPGFPDLIYPAPVGGYAGVAFELKTASGRLSDEQRDWLAWLESQGYRVAVPRSVAEVLGIVSEVFGLGIHPQVLENRAAMIDAAGCWTKKNSPRIRDLTARKLRV